MGNYFESGSWKVICDVCGREFRAHQLTQRWDGLMVCKDDWEPRQPQDFVRGVADKIAPPWTRPDQTGLTLGNAGSGTGGGGGGGGTNDDGFIGTVCDQTTSQGVAGVGVAGCAKAGQVLYVCTANGTIGIAGVGTTGCMKVGTSTPSLNFLPPN